MKNFLTLIAFALVVFTANAQSNLKGDMNDDGEKNVTDVMLLVNDILNGPPKVYLSCPDDNHPHMIDLGLPSGTKWACCNVGADKPEVYGGYYAWGETETKSDYSQNTYQYYQNGSYVNLDDDIAGTQYDVAFVKWGGSWVMPSLDQIKELVNCIHEVTTINGVKGQRFIGTNGGSVFLPLAGKRRGPYLENTGTGGVYWSSKQYTHKDWISGTSFYHAYWLSLNSGGDATYSYGGRTEGYTVRPVSK